jgi:hypothetical protein
MLLLDAAPCLARKATRGGVDSFFRTRVRQGWQRSEALAELPRFLNVHARSRDRCTVRRRGSVCADGRQPSAGRRASVVPRVPTVAPSFNAADRWRERGMTDFDQNPMADEPDDDVAADEQAAASETQAGEANAVIQRWRGVLNCLLKLFGLDSKPRFYMFQGIMAFGAFATFVANYFQPKYRDNAADPQRPFLAPMHMMFLLWGLIEDCGAIYFHHVLMDIHRKGVLEKLLGKVPKVPVPFSVLATAQGSLVLVVGTCA